MKFRFCLLVFFASFYYGDAYVPRFLRGRPRGGFVGSPGLGHLSVRERIQVLSNVAPEQWFTQKLNHFDGSDTRTWKQRYFTNGDYYKAGGPLFVMIGGEGTADPIWMKEGQWIEMAKANNAYCVMLEHRFYGKSHPTPDMSNENLIYLSSEQALADLAAFITNKKVFTRARKVITFGGSYPGCLSAWFRLKYPHLVNGAVSTSGPLLAEVNFKGYLKVVTESLGTYKRGQECVIAIQTATNKIETMIQSDVGRRKIKDMFTLCDKIDPYNANDIANLYSTLTGNFEGVVQYNKDNRAFEGAPATNITIDVVCGVMVDSSRGDEVARYAEVNNMLLKAYKADCQDFKYDSMIDDLKETSWNSSAAEGGRQWTYQTCTEFGFYQSSDYPKQPFGQGFPIKFWTQQCADIYGPHYTEQVIQAAVNRSNIDYGALDVQYDHVVFVNGRIDPWHYLGKLQPTKADQAIVIPDTAHCANMYPARQSDPPTLVEARQTIAKIVRDWVKERS